MSVPSFFPRFSHFFFGVLGHEGVSRKTRTLEQAECGSSREVIMSPRIARRLVTASSYNVHTYIHGCCAKTMCSKHYSTYILGKLHGEKEIADTAEFVTVAGEFR